MPTIHVEVQRDYIQRLATSQSPLSALAELIWNALDADAHTVEVVILRNQLHGIEGITVTDDGHGFSPTTALESFKNLGGSWKRTRGKTKDGRRLHGKRGKGRFQAFALADKVTWTTRYSSRGAVYKYEISGDASNPGRFQLSEEAPSGDSEPGTTVELTSITRNLTALHSPQAIHRLTGEFALYLREYHSVSIVFDGQDIDPSDIEENVAHYPLELTLQDGREVTAKLTVIEWNAKTERTLYLCDESRFSHLHMPPGIQAPGFHFTAYLSSALIGDLSKSGDLHLQDLNPELQPLLSAAKNALRDHFRARAAEQAGNLVEHWKEEEVYPFDETPSSPVEEVERQVFDVLALNVHEYVPDFGANSVASRKLSFRLLRTALGTSPEAVQRILKDVLNLPAERLREFAELLDRTSLEAIINASKIVANRLDFLKGLEVLLFSPEGKKNTLERKNLHQILAEHTWVFGEEFNLAVSDRGLTTVLRRHLDLSDRQLLEDGPVLREDGTQGIVDLMFSRVVPQARPENKEHLVVELKRPKVKIDSAVTNQVESYATAVARDPRFRDTRTRWEFWAVSNEVSDTTRLKANQAQRPPGLLLDLEEPRLRIWVKTWGQLFEDCTARLQFFQEKLEYEATEGRGLDYLRRVHENYLPEEFRATRTA